MDQTHLHLVITHLPIFGSILGAFVLGYGIWSNSNQTKIAAYFLFLISAIGAGVAYLTGESAEETVEDIQGISENVIGQHEDFALFALVSLIVLGVSSLVALFITYKNSPVSKTLAGVILLISLMSFALVAWTGYLGGQIRHSEITTGAVQNSGGQEEGDADGD